MKNRRSPPTAISAAARAPAVSAASARAPFKTASMRRRSSPERTYSMPVASAAGSQRRHNLRLHQSGQRHEPGLYVGICGTSEKATDSVGTVENCTNSGTVTGSYVVGGICGSSENSGNITNCYNTGDVVGTSTDGYVGGICGLMGSVGPLKLLQHRRGQRHLFHRRDCQAERRNLSAYNTGVVTGSGQVRRDCRAEQALSHQRLLPRRLRQGRRRHCAERYRQCNAGQYKLPTSGSTTVKTAEQFASGEVYWLLNGSHLHGRLEAGYRQRRNALRRKPISPALRCIVGKPKQVHQQRCR